MAVAGLAACGAGSIVHKADPVAFTVNVKDHASDVVVSTLVEASVESGELQSVTLSGTAADGENLTVPGELSSGTWRAQERLEPGSSYRLRLTATDSDGRAHTDERTFRTEALDLTHQVYPSVAPLNGETVGVGMPVIVLFDIPVSDRETFERHMAVTATPSVEGSWSWLNDREVHWRPQEFWAPGTQVHVALDLNSLPAGGGIYGQVDQDIDFTIGRSAVSTVNVASHTLTYTEDGQVVRKIPVTTGDARHRTRAGTKVIMELHEKIDMDALSTGVDRESPDYYNIEDVQWAMRLTGSGEFLHAAPWSVGAQGRANVSHGCTGMSTANADWLFHHSMRGDIVVYINSPRPMESGNGWTDWNVSWDEWLAGSALPPPTVSPTTSATASPSTL